MLDLKPDSNQTTASHHCNFAAPDMGTTFRAGGANVTHLSSLSEDMAVALCFLHQKSAGNFAGIDSGDADKTSALSRAWTVPRAPAEPVLCGNVHVFFFPKETPFNKGWYQVSQEN